MSYVDTNGVFLSSASNIFSLGFSVVQENSVFLSIVHISSQKPVWTANRDAPISPTDQFNFSTDGNLALVRLQTNSVAWSVNSSGTHLQLHDSGNLALLDASNSTLWQSFDHPTDTLLAGQVLLPDMQLISSISPTNFSSGPYSLLLQSGDLHLVFDSGIPQPYWSMSQDSRIVNYGTGAPSYAVLNFTGLSLVKKDTTIVSQFTWSNNASLCRATLESDGNFRIYVYSSNIWTQQLQALTSGCDLPLFCGHYGVCTYEQCSCPEAFQPLNDRNITQGCQGPTTPPCTNSSTSVALVHYQNIGDGLDYFANPFTLPLKTSGLASCQDLCTQNCSCSSFFFYNESGFCYLMAQLASIQSTPNYGHALYVKTSGQVQPASQIASPPTGTSAVPPFVLPLIITGSIFIIAVLICSFLYWYFKVHKGIFLRDDNTDDDTFLEAIPGLPTRFSFKELQIATNNFSKTLGTGGFGSVYEGVLPDKTTVAVKQLESIGQGKREFRAEVAIIGSIHHVHLVQLRGFCAEGVHRLLVYEFMSNGSLDKCLFVDGQKSKLLDWKTRYNIALGTARGLAYLHDDCREKIIHCDIKPENILLDDNYNAKVSDFGLAKLLNKEQSQIFTTMRGTRGYLAPEWLMNLAVSEKSDVYSFGMVLLEIISGRKNYDPSQTSEKLYFPAYAFQQAEFGKLEQLVDIRFKGSLYENQIIQTVKIALWCIQEDTSTRPSMGKVVQMLEGNVKVQQPPLSSQLAVRLHARMIEAMHSSTDPSSSASDRNSQDLLSAIQLSAPR